MSRSGRIHPWPGGWFADLVHQDVGADARVRYFRSRPPGKLYLSPEHEKMNCGVHSPGPVSYTLHESTGKQALSKNCSMPSWGFGTANRWTADKQTRSHTPGPGAYCV